MRVQFEICHVSRFPVQYEIYDEQNKTNPFPEQLEGL